MLDAWIVLVTGTTDLYIMSGTRAVHDSINLTWSKVAETDKPVVSTEGRGGRAYAITVRDREGKVLVLAKRMREIPYHEEGTHL